MRRALPPTALIATLAVLATAATTAGAATQHVVTGRGWGHGVGMSQYGAYGLARHGHGYRGILAHYYRRTGVSISRTHRIRVLLQASDPYVRFSNAVRGPGGRRMNAGTTYVVRRSTGGRLSVSTSGGRLIGRFRAPFAVSAPRGGVGLLGPAINGLSSGRYRGYMNLRLGLSGGVTAINAPTLDQYVRGVVPAEMPASWHMEALKAQAVAARTYALATRNRGGVFDVYPDTRSQVYRGVSAEHPRANAAVGATARRVVTFRRQVIVTFFFSTSGGRTENVENVFGSTPRPYLSSVSDPYDSLSPRHRWRLTFTTGQMTARLRGLVKGSFVRIAVLNRGRSPRILRARIDGTGGSTVVGGTTLRSRLGLYDTWAYFSRVATGARAARAPSRPAPRAAGVYGVGPNGTEGPPVGVP